jgi:hypothetical protein
MIVIVPSRGRPKRAVNMVQSVKDTASQDVRVVVVVDPDDPTLPDYRRKVKDLVVLPERLRYSASLNLIAREVWDTEDILGAYGDDVIFRTKGWDDAVRAAPPGIVFGNDLAHGSGWPTAVWMSSPIAKALGWLALPECRHLYVDNAWKAIGDATGILTYLPEVIVEHMHEVYGKAPKDQTYIDVYDDNGARDYVAWKAWEQDGLADAIERVRAIL